MDYTRFFASVIKQSGPPLISPEQFARMMNIVSLENRIEALMALGMKHLDIRIFRIIKVEAEGLKEKLNKLTGEKDPFEVFQDMVNRSNN